MSKKQWKEEFTLDGFLLYIKTPSNFVTSQWQFDNKVSIFYLIYKLIFATIFTSVLTMSFIQFHNRAKWIIYLTNLGYMLCTIQALFSFFIILRELLLQTHHNYEKAFNTTLYGFYWVLFTIAIDSALVITAIYWTCMYDKYVPLTVLDVFLHGLNSVMMVIDLIITGQPVRILHFFWSLLFGIGYVVFTGIYYVAGGTDVYGNNFIYAILDWNEPIKALLISLIALLVLILLHLFTFLIYLARYYIYMACKKSNFDET